MTARRRARSTGIARTAGEIPPELGNPDSPVWGDLEAVAELAEVYGVDYVEPLPSFIRDPYFERFRTFRRTYAERFGFMSEKWPNTLDLHRLKAAGIYAASRGPRWRLLPDGSVVPVTAPRLSPSKE